MLDAVIIVLRETLEASLLVGLLFVYSNHFMLNKKWLFGSLIQGIFLSLIVAYQLPSISDLFEGVGQELLFFSVLASLSLLILWANWLVIFRAKNYSFNKLMLKLIYSSIVLLAVSLEGAEISIYLQSRFLGDEPFYSSLIGAMLGLGIGLSLGAISYYLLDSFSKLGLSICLGILTLVSAGMGLQAYSYLMQGDLVDSGYPIWNSNFIIDERSILGQLFYALIGYEATPTLAQVLIYLGYIIAPLAFVIYSKIVWQKRS